MGWRRFFAPALDSGNGIADAAPRRIRQCGFGRILMADETFNGYVNRETWAAALHLSNDQVLYKMVRDVVADALNTAGELVGPLTAANALEAWMSQYVEDNRDSLDNGLPSHSREVTMMDREVGSWWRVDWREVADGFMPDED